MRGRANLRGLPIGDWSPAIPRGRGWSATVRALATRAERNGPILAAAGFRLLAVGRDTGREGRSGRESAGERPPKAPRPRLRSRRAVRRFLPVGRAAGRPERPPLRGDGLPEGLVPLPPLRPEDLRGRPRSTLAAPSLSPRVGGKGRRPGEGEGPRAAEAARRAGRLPVRRRLAPVPGGPALAVRRPRGAPGRRDEAPSDRPRPCLRHRPLDGGARNVGPRDVVPGALRRHRARLRRRPAGPGLSAEGRARQGLPRREGHGRPARGIGDGRRRREEVRRNGRARRLPRGRARLLDRHLRRPVPLGVAPLPLPQDLS